MSQTNTQKTFNIFTIISLL